MRRFFFCILVLLTTTAFAQKNNFGLIKGTTAYPTWRVTGDYTSYNSLAIKINLGDDEYLQRAVSQSYSAPTTTLSCTLYVNDTQDLDNGDYYFNIYAFGADTVVLVAGYMKLTNNVFLAPVPINVPRYSIIAVDSSAEDPGVLISWNSYNTIEWISIDSLTSLLDIQPGGGTAGLDTSAVQGIVESYDYVETTETTNWDKDASDDVDADSIYTKTSHIVNVKEFGAVGDSTTDDATAIQNALTYLFNQGGGELYLPQGNYIVNSLLTIPRESTASGDNPYRSRPIKITGAGAFMSGRNVSFQPIGGTILIMNYSGNEGYKIFAGGNSLLEISGVTFYSPGADSNAFILTTNTVLQIHNCAFWGARSATSANQDAIILGGLYGGNPARTDSSGFQGYGTVIRENYFNLIRRAVYGRTFANNIVVRDNNIWNACGSNLANGAAIEFEGNLNEPVPNAISGSYIAGNLIESPSYGVGIKLKNAHQFTIIGNSMWDVSDPSFIGYYLDEGALYNYIVVGHHSDLITTYYEYETGQNTIINPHQNQYSIWGQNFQFNRIVRFINTNPLYWANPSDVTQSFHLVYNFTSQPQYVFYYQDTTTASNQMLLTLQRVTSANVTLTLGGSAETVLSTEATNNFRIQEESGSVLWLGRSNNWYRFGDNLITTSGYMQFGNASTPGSTVDGVRLFGSDDGGTTKLKVVDEAGKITVLSDALELSDIQLFIDTLYRSNDTIYFVQEDGSKLFFVDNNSGGDISAYWDSTEVKDYITVIMEGDTSIFTLNEIDSLLYILHTNDGAWLTGNQTITLSGDVSGTGTTAITVTVADDSHNHIISNVDGLQDTLNKFIEYADTVSKIATQYDLSQVTGGGLTQEQVENIVGDSSAVLRTLISSAIDSGYYLYKTEMFDGSGVAMTINPIDSGDVLLIIVTGIIPETWASTEVFLRYDASNIVATGALPPPTYSYTMSGYVVVDDTGDVGFGIYNADGEAYAENQFATIMTFKPGILASSGSGGSFDSTYVYQVADSLGDRISYLEGLIASLLEAVEGCCDLSDNTPPSPPENLLATAISSSEVEVTWTDPEDFDLDSVRVYRYATNDSSSASWIASVGAGVEYYLDDDKGAEQEFWYWAKAMDDSSNLSYFSNEDSTTTFPEGGGGGDFTDSLWYHWDEEDYTSSTWTDKIKSFVMNDVSDPAITDSGIVLDGNDGFNNNSAPAVPMPITVEMVVKIVTNSSGNETLLSWYKDPNVINIYLSNGTLFIRANDGTGVSAYYNAAKDSLADFAHLVITFDGDTIKTYTNGSLLSASGTSGANDMDNERLSFGCYEGGSDFLDANSILRLFRIYHLELTPAQINTRYNHSSVQDKL